jgi:hypothetical protein
MFMNKIFCLGDGYAHGHIWPEWPQILQALLPDYEIVVLSGIGAGNEFLINNLLAQGDSIQSQSVIFQWADCQRFDKLVQDQEWIEIGRSDPVYHFNFYSIKDQNWWLSSASTNEKIRQYHNFYIQNEQSLLRFCNQKILVENYLQNNQCNYYFTSTQKQMYFSKDNRFKEILSKEVQPLPLIHFYFSIEILLPNLNIIFDQKRAAILKEKIENQNWTPYDPNREEIWKKIVEELS